MPQATKRFSPWIVLVVMCAGYFLVLLDVTIVNVALPRLGDGLHAGVSGLQWVVDGYALALAALMLAGGMVGDRYGHRRVVLTGLVTFGVGSLGCGLAPTVEALVAARVAQGAGAALLLPGTLAIISTAFPAGRQQARAIGVWAGVGSVALPAGPLLGGLLIDGFGWRAVFLVNVPIVLAAIAAAAAVVREDRREPAGHRLDVLGALLGGLVLLAILLAGIEVDRIGVWPVAAAAGGLGLVAFLLVERRKGDAAMLPLPLFRRRGFTVANAVAGTMNLCTLGTLFVLTLFLQSVLDYSPLVAGLAIVPLFAPLAVLAPFAGRLTGRIGPRYPIVAGLSTAAGGLALLGLVPNGWGYPALLPAFLLWGIGLGILTPAVVAAAIAAVPAGRAGLASAINNTARQAGGAIGIALAGGHSLRVVAMVSAVLYVSAATVAGLRPSE